MSFAELAPYLVDYGYQPVPIRPGTKAPTICDRQAGHPPEHYSAGLRALGRRNPHRDHPAIDLDIRDRGVVRQNSDPSRRGHVRARPDPDQGRALPQGTPAVQDRNPVREVTSHWFALPGEDFTARRFQGTSRSRSRPPATVRGLCDPPRYRPSVSSWTRGGPLYLPAHELRPDRAGQAQAFLAVAESTMFGDGHGPAGAHRRPLPPRCAGAGGAPATTSPAPAPRRSR